TNSFTTIQAPVDYYVSTTGLDTNPGTFAEPFATITKAATVMNAGDTCYVRGGAYHETATAANLAGLSYAPITFKPYQDEVVVFDGTEAISDIQTNGWVVHSGNIYKTTLTKDIWQLFDDGEMMISARWPNARYDDDSVWQQDATW
ncbi:MAG: right-handed parallel beta-helix repeat-containing protein, partial [Planctomycetota bacterium]